MAPRGIPPLSQQRASHTVNTQRYNALWAYIPVQTFYNESCCLVSVCLSGKTKFAQVYFNPHLK